MAIQSKINVEDFLKTNSIIKVEIGAGLRRQIEGAITLDQWDSPAIDIVANLNDGLSLFPDNSIDEIHSSHVLEHIEKLDELMKEMYRVLKPGGKMCGTVPHFSNAYYYSDYTHQKYFGLYTFSYFSNQDYFKRKVPAFYTQYKYEIHNIKLEFASPFPIRNIIRRCFQGLFNLNNFMKEFYEENLTGFISTFQIRFDIRKPLQK
jgi:ubiquinone/menaquinone biosynthesis C-methylase UbiE